ncbi:glycosyltransferase [Marinicella litoralis]|uniref:Glycosyltransferase involved in cell wall biosynthesis n=1 Tax=Marinicella litoralis TaxID=644220 RepID=A0A4R6XQG0_9GAMM|nr:glycosyltransferase [Marinicella litoralis]TDR19593.1 glycosyltransferase involved in cell wall biosynthesis [Marinicella litoralis]
MIAAEGTNKPLKKKLTIMQVLPRMHVGGVERGTLEFSIYLKQQGHRPIVVSHGGPLVDELQRNGIKHIQLNVAKKSLLSLLSIKKIRKIIIEQGVEVVHARSRIPAWLCYWALKNMQQRPCFITTLHGLHSVNKYSSVMARGDRVIAVSATAKAYLNEHFTAQLKHDPVLIYRGVDAQFQYGYTNRHQWLQNMCEQFNGFNAWKKVLLPGRLSAVKGAEHLLSWLTGAPAATRLLLTACPDESNYSQNFHKKLQALGLDEKVVWLGVVRAMPDLYAAVDVVVSTNNKPESFGRTVLEALTVGKPVVAFDHGGVSEIMNRLYPEGLVDNGDDMALAEKINQFLQHAPTVKPHDEFQNTSMFEHTLALYQEALGQT